MKKSMKFDLSSTIEELEQDIKFSARVIHLRGRLFLELTGEKRDDHEQIKVTVPLQEAVKRIARGFDPNYDPNDEEQAYLKGSQLGVQEQNQERLVAA